MFDVGAGADPADINSANAAFWQDRANRPASRDAAPTPHAEQARLQGMQRANDAFWAEQTAHQRAPAREWGRG